MKDYVLGAITGAMFIVLVLFWALKGPVEDSFDTNVNLAFEVAELERERNYLRDEVEKMTKVIAAAEVVILYSHPNGHWRGEVNMQGSAGPLDALKSALDNMKDE